MTRISPTLSGYQVVEKIHVDSCTLSSRGIGNAGRETIVIKILGNESLTFSRLIQFRNPAAIANI